MKSSDYGPRSELNFNVYSIARVNQFKKASKQGNINPILLQNQKQKMLSMQYEPKKTYYQRTKLDNDRYQMKSVNQFYKPDNILTKLPKDQAVQDDHFFGHSTNHGQATGKMNHSAVVRLMRNQIVANQSYQKQRQKMQNIMTSNPNFGHVDVQEVSRKFFQKMPTKIETDTTHRQFSTDSKMPQINQKQSDLNINLLQQQLLISDQNVLTPLSANSAEVIDRIMKKNNEFNKIEFINQYYDKGGKQEFQKHRQSVDYAFLQRFKHKVDRQRTTMSNSVMIQQSKALFKPGNIWDTSKKAREDEIPRDQVQIEEQLYQKRLKSQEFERMKLIKIQEKQF